MIRRFNRYELKYIVSVEKAAEIMKDLKELTEPDEYGGYNGYPIVSLYYDSPNMDFFWAKIEGIKFRRKLRLRIYPSMPIENTNFGMVEIKQRINRTVQKKRLKLPIDEAEALCEGTIVNNDLDPMDRQVASEVQYMVSAMHLRPTCITAYHRKAFIGGLYDAGLRITFDTNVSYRTHGFKINQDAVNHLILPPTFCIMEVKVNESVPDWVTSLLARHGCQIGRVSKYCAGISQAQEKALLPLTMTTVPGMETAVPETEKN